ncbi:MAG: hydroxypyruvate isomerase [Anaerolineae bacterium]
MPKFAANLTMLYADSPFLARFARAKASGFRYVEYLFPYEHDISALATALAENGLQQVLFNLPAGDWAAGERGIAALPGRVEEFRTGVARAIQVAQALHVPRLNCLVGRRDPAVPLADQQAVMIENLRYAAKALAAAGITLLVEMLNPFDVPGFLIDSPRAAFEVQDRVGHANLKIQYDIYHAQRTQGELANTLRAHLERIGHIQIADNPGRGQPGTGEINYRFLFDFMDAIGYVGYVGLEYVPVGTVEQSLAWVQEYGYVL